MVRKSKKSKKTYNLQDYLDSDDELPTDYNEIPYVPAYQNDNRFEYIEEQKKTKTKTMENQNKMETKNQNKSVTKDTMETRKQNSITLDGYLNKKDTFCFQCLEPVAVRDTLLWFFKFLKLKDLQSNYMFLTTCLVPVYCNNYFDH